MLENPFKMPKLAMPLEMMASIIRKQHSFVLSENLDNSQYTGTTAQVVYLNMYTHIHPLLWDGYLYTFVLEVLVNFATELSSKSA